MTDEPNQPSPMVSIVVIAGLFAFGFFGYKALFPSDLAKVRSCISSMMEASRGDGLYGEFRAALAEVDRANDVIITSQRHYQIAGDLVLSIEYKIDGHQRGIMCAR